MISAISRPSLAYGSGRVAATGEGTYQNKPAFSLADVQGESAKANHAKANSEVQHAATIKSFASKGLTLTLRTRTDDYKDAAMNAVDSDKDGAVSTVELSKHVLAYGGTAAQAAALYAAMDIDVDGIVSGREFKDSIPDPFNTPSFSKKLSDITLGSNAHPALIGELFRSQADEAPITAVLGDLARKVST